MSDKSENEKKDIQGEEIKEIPDMSDLFLEEEGIRYAENELRLDVEELERRSEKGKPKRGDSKLLMGSSSKGYSESEGNSVEELELTYRKKAWEEKQSDMRVDAWMSRRQSGFGGDGLQLVRRHGKDKMSDGESVDEALIGSAKGSLIGSDEKMVGVDPEMLKNLKNLVVGDIEKQLVFGDGPLVSQMSSSQIEKMVNEMLAKQVFSGTDLGFDRGARSSYGCVLGSEFGIGPVAGSWQRALEWSKVAGDQTFERLSPTAGTREKQLFLFASRQYSVMIARHSSMIGRKLSCAEYKTVRYFMDSDIQAFLCEVAVQNLMGGTPPPVPSSLYSGNKLAVPTPTEFSVALDQAIYNTRVRVAWTSLKFGLPMLVSVIGFIKYYMKGKGN